MENDLRRSRLRRKAVKNRRSKISHTDSVLPSSFRDPSGFIYQRSGTLYRQVNQRYKKDYDLFVESGLCRFLLDEELLIKHEEIPIDLAQTNAAYRVIKPEVIPFVSYPYEWSFSQLKDAALLTLEVQLEAMKYGMSLKDASAYNIQFVRGKPILIDTLSFEEYRHNSPWIPYRQFCQHFLCPLVLMEKTDVRLNQLLRIYMDGVPIDLASKLLGNCFVLAYARHDEPLF